uniref:Transmembrane protein n=1 Tax=Toxoplasma gondii (strain ATCC 50861 / VEG) TaxID=432359 RepID=A0A0F7UQ97_TOXGV|nr:TPA: hypothetical protein BN1205_056100 [Toxoplasma gondii VEG]
MRGNPFASKTATQLSPLGMVQRFSEMRAAGSFTFLAWFAVFLWCFSVSCIRTEAKNLKIDVVDGITKTDAHVPHLGAGDTITVKFKRPVAGEQDVSLLPYDLENGPYPVGVYRICNRKARVSWQELFPNAAADFQFVKWNNASVSTLIITTPAAPEQPDGSPTDYCFELKDNLSTETIVVVAVAGAHRVAGRGFFSQAAFSTILATAGLLVTSLHTL